MTLTLFGVNDINHALGESSVVNQSPVDRASDAARSQTVTAPINTASDTDKTTVDCSQVTQ